MPQNTTEFVQLPMLALRGLHVFPGMMLTFDVERAASVASLNAAVKNDQLIFLAAQKLLTADMPQDLPCRGRQYNAGPEGLYGYGSPAGGQKGARQRRAP